MRGLRTSPPRRSPTSFVALMSLFYTAYGLTLRADFPLPGLRPRTPTPSAVDVIVHFGNTGGPSLTAGIHGCYAADANVAHFHWDAYGTYCVRDGREIVVAPSPSEPSLPHVPVTGVLLGVLLHQRGQLTLHASAVTQGEDVIAFVGPKGAGKSTTAAAFCAQGYDLISDDVVAIVWVDGVPYVQSGGSQLKLFPDAASAVGLTPDRLPRLHPQLSKRRACVRADGTTNPPRPLRAIYLLADDPAEIRITALTAAEAIPVLLGHSYAQRFLGSSSATPEHFRACSELAAAGLVHRLARPRQLNRLSSLAAIVASHASAKGPTSPPASVQKTGT